MKVLPKSILTVFSIACVLLAMALAFPFFAFILYFVAHLLAGVLISLGIGSDIAYSKPIILGFGLLLISVPVFMIFYRKNISKSSVSDSDA